MTYTWSAPQSNGGSAITGYQLSGTDPGATISARVPSVSYSFTASRMPVGISSFTIGATTAFGTGPLSSFTVTVNTAHHFTC